jgi:hypothetical protein
MTFDSLKKQLVGRLHDILRRQLFGGVSSNGNGVLKENSASVNGVLEDSSTSANGVVEENLVSRNGVDESGIGRRIDEVSGSN